MPLCRLSKRYRTEFLLELSTISVIRNNYTQQASSHQARSTTLERDTYYAVQNRLLPRLGAAILLYIDICFQQVSLHI